ncbi:DinB family protein [Bacillus oleivorans]|uniref:DinB family protein n=1 Tax=Bacillus oleivorans TaxID=1448271 RepID=A0A285CQA2_9BACI|nr:DinB family protein [Bacillus oleivorans]SNX69727.1 DinB family protein [Bacillus oleivorans]
MTHVKDILTDQFLANANDASWYRPFSESVEDLTEEQALWKPNENCLSIAEIVQHLIYWNQCWQTRYIESSIDSAPSIADNIESFKIPENITFKELKETLLDVLLRWDGLLTTEKIESDVIGFSEKAKWWQILGNSTTHNAYHIGQIIFIRKLQNSWKTDK